MALARLRVSTAQEPTPAVTTEFDYGPYNRVTEVRELDFDGTSVLRRTRTAYVSDPGYVGRHILALPSVVEVFGSGDVPAARTEYLYDAKPLKDTPGVVGHAPSHDPYAPAVWVPPYDERECEGERTPPCQTIHHAGYWLTEFEPATRFRGNPTAITRYADPSALAGSIVERRTYDITGNLVVSASAPFERSEFDYVLRTQYAYPTRRVRGPPESASERIISETAYDFATGVVTTATDANGRSVTASHDSGTLRPITVRSSTGATTTFDYDDQQLTVTETTRDDAGTLLGRSTTLRNGLGLLSSVTRLTGSPPPGGAEPPATITRNRYDALGQLWMTQTGPYQEGAPILWTEFSHDALGRLTRVRTADGSERAAFYNEPARPDGARPGSEGETSRLVDAWQRERWLRHDALGRLAEVVEPAPDGDGTVFSAGGASTLYAYDALGHVTQITGPQPTGRVRAMRYDGLGRLTHLALRERFPTLTDVGEYRPAGDSWSDVIAYADATRLASHTDARGVRTTFNYANDPLGRLRQVTYEPAPANPAPVSTAAVTFDYVAAGDLQRLERITTDRMVEAYAYDDQGRLASTSLTLADHADAPLVVGYGYDALDRVRRLTYPARYGQQGEPRRVVEVDRDLAGRPRQLTVDGIAQAADALYSAVGVPESLTVGPQNGLPVLEVYDVDPATSRVTGQRVQRGDETLLDLAYSYERDGLAGATGQLVRAVDRLDARRTVTYGYDVLWRLREARAGAEAPLWRQTYGYDGLGNRTTVTADGTGLDGQPIPRDGLPILNHDAATNRIASTGFEYDDAGNLSRSLRSDGAGQRYLYDGAGRLAAVLDDAGQALRTYGYAADRRRITIRSVDGDTETVRVWDRRTVIAEYQTAEGAPLRASRELVHLGPRLLCTYDAVDDASMNGDAGAAVIHYHHPDRLSTRVVTAPRTGAADAVEPPDVEILTLPYGTALATDPASQVVSLFAGYRRDLATGLDDAVNRDYDPRLGRFIAPDPIAPAGTRAELPQTANAYTYGAGDPVNNLDPLGLIDIPWLNRWNEGGRRQEWDPVQEVWVETIEVRAPASGPGRVVSQEDLNALARQVQGTRTERRGGAAGRGGGPQPRQQSCRETLADIFGNPEIFMWGAVDGNRHLGGPVKITGETIGLAGFNLTGPYYGAIGAVGIEVEAAGGHGALFGGVERITQHDWAGGAAQHELGPIALLELGNTRFVGGLYSHHLTTTGTGMYVGMSFGPLSVGVGSNLDAALALVVYRAMKYVLNPNRPTCTP